MNDKKHDLLYRAMDQSLTDDDWAELTKEIQPAELQLWSRLNQASDILNERCDKQSLKVDVAHQVMQQIKLESNLAQESLKNGSLLTGHKVASAAQPVKVASAWWQKINWMPVAVPGFAAVMGLLFVVWFVTQDLDSTPVSPAQVAQQELNTSASDTNHVIALAAPQDNSGERRIGNIQKSRWGSAVASNDQEMLDKLLVQHSLYDNAIGMNGVSGYSKFTSFQSVSLAKDTNEAISY